MGTAGHTKLEEMIIGTNTEKVVRHAKCPVLTVHKKPVTTDFKNIVYATSMSKDEEVFSRVVRSTQQMYDSAVHLVRINTPGNALHRGDVRLLFRIRELRNGDGRQDPDDHDHDQKFDQSEAATVLHHALADE